MARSQPRTIFGIDSVAFYSRLTGVPYGDVRVLAGSSVSLAGEVVTLTGGSSRFVWDAQDGLITSEISFKPKEIPNFLFNLLLGKEPTEVLASSGSVANFANVKNATAFDAIIGVLSATVKAGSEADLKFGKYVMLVVSPSTVDIYGLVSADYQRGVDITEQNDLKKITATPLTITTDTAVDIPDLGVELTGGSGVIAMVAGDTAEFEVNPPSFEQMDVVIGEHGVCIPEFGAVVTSQKQANGSFWIIDCYRVKAQGYPFGMEEKAYNEAEITGTIIYDAAKNGVIKARHMRPTSGCN